MAYRILITGGTGFIGTELVNSRLALGDEIVILTRRPQYVTQYWQGKVHAITQCEHIQRPIDLLINLAGAGISDKRWSKQRKQVLRDSRIALSEQLYTWALRSKQHFKQVISASAVGFYAPKEAQLIDENQPQGTGFASNLCADWEQTMQPFQQLTDALCIIRSGIVLGRTGGMLSRLWRPFRLGLGGTLASGKQYMPWIHIDDEIAAINFLIQHQQAGTFNLCAPNPVSNAYFTQSLAKKLKRPALLPIPKTLLELIFAEMSCLLLDSHRAIPKNLQQQGFTFQYTELDKALNHLLKKKSGLF